MSPASWSDNLLTMFMSVYPTFKDEANNLVCYVTPNLLYVDWEGYGRGMIMPEESKLCSVLVYYYDSWNEFLELDLL